MADQEDEPQQDKPDPNVYQPDQESDDIEIDRRIRRANERLKRMTMVGFPQINETFGCQDTLTVEGGFDTGWAVNYIDCGMQAAREGGTPPALPCCPQPTLACDQISASDSVCGFGTPNLPGRCFLRWDASGSNDLHTTHDCSTGPTTVDDDHTHSTRSGAHREYADDTCPTPTSTSGTISGSHDIHQCNGSSSSTPISGSYTVTTDWLNCTFCGTPTTVIGVSGTTITTTVTNSNTTAHSTCDETCIRVDTYSDERSAPDCTLPDYDDDFNDPCGASRDDQGCSCSLSAFKYKWTWAEPLSADCTVYWIERTYDSDNNPVGDVEMSEDVAAGSTESSIHEVDPPSENGHISVLLLKACCVGADCSKQTEEDCTNMGGESLSNCDCTSTDCTGACCDYSGDDPTCSITDRTTCEESGRSWVGAGTTCDPFPC